MKKLKDVKTRHYIPNWDEYYMSMVLMVATKSKDPSTQCGAIMVDKDNRVLSIGYNGPYRGFPDEETIVERPAKYSQWIHSEENAILNYSGSRVDMEGSTMYVTAKPCTRCLRMMIQSGIKRIVYNTGRKIALSGFETESDTAWEEMVKYSDVEIVEKDFDPEVNHVFLRAIGIMNNRKEI